MGTNTVYLHPEWRDPQNLAVLLLAILALATAFGLAFAEAVG